MLRPLALLDQPGQFDAAHVRHPDVEHNGREVVAQEVQQGLVGGPGADQDAIAWRQHGLEDIEVDPSWKSSTIRDLQGHGLRPWSFYRYSQTRNSDRS